MATRKPLVIVNGSIQELPYGDTVNNLVIMDDGSSLTTTPVSLNFVGSGVSVSNSSNDITISISTSTTGSNGFESTFLLMGA